MIVLTSKGPLELSQELFWDIPEARVVAILDDNPQWVIPRVFEYGTLDEISGVIDFYGETRSKEVLVEMKNELKPMTKAMAHIYLDLELRNHVLKKSS